MIAAISMAIGCDASKATTIDLRTSDASADASKIDEGVINISAVELPFDTVKPGGTVQIANDAFENTGNIPNGVTFLCFRLDGALSHIADMTVDVRQSDGTLQAYASRFERPSTDAPGFVCPIIDLKINAKDKLLVESSITINDDTPIGSTFRSSIDETNDHAVALETTDIATQFPVKDATITVVKP